jgi:peroxiredoxin
MDRAWAVCRCVALTALGSVCLAVLVETVEAARPTADIPPRGDAISDPLLILLRTPGIHRELDLSKDQLGALDRLVGEVDPLLWRLRDLQFRGEGEKAWQLVDRVADGLPQVLRPPQQARLDGLLLQARGLDSLLWPSTATALGLSEEQSLRITQLFAETRQELQRRSETSANRPAPRSSGNGAPYVESQQRKILAILTSAQQQQLRQLRGNPFDWAGIPKRFARPIEPVGIEAWVNTEPLKLERLRGKVVIFHFWTYGCINCIHNLPFYQDWQKRFAPRGAVLLGVHTPETEAEHQLENVKNKVKEYQIEYAVAVDTQKETWNAWGNHMWPSVYLIDKGGYIRYWWYGELNWQGAHNERLFAKRIEELLAEPQ